MEAALPSPLQKIALDDCQLNPRLRQILPLSLRSTATHMCPTDEDDEDDVEGYRLNYIPLHLNPTESDDINPQLDSSSVSSTSSSTTSNKQYTCSFCQKRFMRPSSLKIHVYSHTGEKPFRCSFPGCKRRFSVQSNMRRHLRVHTN
jgi:uncharacterized Zn-finger protein